VSVACKLRSVGWDSRKTLARLVAEPECRSVFPTSGDAPAFISGPKIVLGREAEVQRLKTPEFLHW